MTILFVDRSKPGSWFVAGQANTPEEKAVERKFFASRDHPNA